MDEWIISASMQPMLQMSMAWSYFFWVSMISGARYHLDTTQFESSLFSFYRAGLCSYYAALTFRLNNFSYLACSSGSPYLLICFRSFLRKSLKALASSFFLGMARARPKSQILTLQFESIRKLPGFMSLWIIFAECMKFRAQREL